MNNIAEINNEVIRTRKLYYFGAKNIYSISILMGALSAIISLVIGSYKRGGEKNENHERVYL
jgi:hypothetical protein